MAGAVTPPDLGARAELLVDKHARYIKSFAEVLSSTAASAQTLCEQCCGRMVLLTADVMPDSRACYPALSLATVG